MYYIVARHKVSDYKTWKKGFDSALSIRKAGGEKSFQILRVDNDKNNILLLFEWDNLKNARKFFESPELQKAMQQAGVLEKPDVYFLEEIDRGRL
jgi:heme-degrading monooxygenase HmoA